MNKFDKHYTYYPYWKRRLKFSLSRFRLVRRIYWKFNRKKQVKKFYEDLEIVSEADPLILEWPDGIKKPVVGLINEFFDKDPDNYEGKVPYSYWPRYKHFLERNEIEYGFLEIHKSNFIEQANKYDIIVWRVLNDPITIWEARTKISILEKQLGKFCLPSSEILWSYEEKVRQYYLLKSYDLPVVNTFVSFSKSEALEYIKHTRYPFVSKINTGASSLDVILIKNQKQARKHVNEVFGNGKKIYWNFVRQKGYVYFQDFIADSKKDVRVTVIGNTFLGIHKRVPHDDFRASGAMLIEKYALPEEALMLAKKVSELFPPSTMLTTDMIWNEENKRYEIIEVSRFVSFLTYEQAKVDDVAGRYIFEDGKFKFEPGKFWPQELSLAELMGIWLELQNSENLIIK